MKKLLLVFVLFPLFIQAQDCDCLSNFEWVKKTFEENDAGAPYIIEKKGRTAYEAHNAAFEQEVKNISNSLECTQTLYQWLTFFRFGHIGISRLSPGQASGSGEAVSDEKIREQFADWEKHLIDTTQFQHYLKRKSQVDYEGIWLSSPYKIGIQKVGDEYIGSVIEADGVYWTEGQVKLKISKSGAVIYYMRDHSPREFDEAILIGNNHLQMGFVTLNRLNPELERDEAAERYMQLISSREPFFEQLNEQTTYLRIPDFSWSEKVKIDSIIKIHWDAIMSAPNMIIDLRNNGGGSDESYYGLLPILYTNRIRTIGMEFRSTPLNNQRMLDFINDPNYGFSEEEKKWAQEAYDTLSLHIGEFVNLDTSNVEIRTYDVVHPYPEQVGIIINENNGSTAEQFLLAAKQSKKVKLFGTTTVGALDISNMYSVVSPCNEFQLGYCLSKSYRIPDMAIDDIGLQPDFFIDSTVPPHRWIDFVMEVMKK